MGARWSRGKRSKEPAGHLSERREKPTQSRQRKDAQRSGSSHRDKARSKREEGRKRCVAACIGLGVPAGSRRQRPRLAGLSPQGTLAFRCAGYHPKRMCQQWRRARCITFKWRMASRVWSLATKQTGAWRGWRCAGFGGWQAFLSTVAAVSRSIRVPAVHSVLWGRSAGARAVFVHAVEPSACRHLAPPPPPFAARAGTSS